MLYIVFDLILQFSPLFTKSNICLSLCNEEIFLIEYYGSTLVQ
jgi:hypothetical protein